MLYQIPLCYELLLLILYFRVLEVAYEFLESDIFSTLCFTIYDITGLPDRIILPCEVQCVTVIDNGKLSSFCATLEGGVS